MSDFGDDMRDWRKRKQDYRRKHSSPCLGINCTTNVYDTDEKCRTCHRENPYYKPPVKKHEATKP